MRSKIQKWRKPKCFAGYFNFLWFRGGKKSNLWSFIRKNRDYSQAGFHFQKPFTAIRRTPRSFAGKNSK
jgi:hypothetical protein